MTTATIERETVQTEEVDVWQCDECGHVTGEVDDDDAALYQVVVNPSVGASSEDRNDAVLSAYHQLANTACKDQWNDVVDLSDAENQIQTAVDEIYSLTTTVEGDVVEDLCRECAETRVGVPLDDPTDADVRERDIRSRRSKRQIEHLLDDHAVRAFHRDDYVLMSCSIALCVCAGIAAGMGEWAFTGGLAFVAILFHFAVWGAGYDQAKPIREVIRDD